MILRLISTDPTFLDAPNLVSGGRYKIGRGSSCEIVVKEMSISREHAELTVDGETVTIKDLKSLNGLFFKELRVEEATLSPGQSIRLGSVTFHLVCQCPPGHELNADESTLKADQPPAPPPATPKREMPQLALLTESQRRVLDLLVNGQSEKDAAARLMVSPHTVHNHIRKIYQCFNVRTRAELLALFVSNSNLGHEREK